MDYHQRELEFMERRLEMEREARKHEMDSLKTMLQALTMQLNATQQANQIAFAKVHATTTYTHKGAEEWIVQERLRADFTEKFRYWHVEFNRWESPNETVLRARVYGYLVKKVPNELHRRVPENDVLGVYYNLVRVNSKPAQNQVSTLTMRVMKSQKESQPMMTWLDRPYDDIESLEKLKQPIDTDLVRTVITENLLKDKRYHLVRRDILAHEEWPMAIIRDHLHGVAAEVGDLVPDSRFKQNRAKKAKEKAKRKAKKAAKLIGDPSGLSNGGTGNTTTPDESRPQANKGQMAHGNQHRPSGRGDSAAEGTVVDKHKRDRLRNEICPYYLAGSCSRGDACPRKHLTLEQTKAWVGKQGKNSKGYSRPQSESKEDESLKPCYQFKQNGSCSFGDNCRFDHIGDPKPVAKMALKRGSATPRVDEQIDYSVGDTVTLDATFPHACMYGMVGRVIALSRDGPDRVFVELEGSMDRYSSLVQEEANRLYSVGLPKVQLLRVPAQVSYRARSAYSAFARNSPEKGGAFSASIICDSGANVFISSVVELFAWLEECDGDGAIEGIGDSPLVCTHRGRVTMKFAHHERHIIGFYAPSDVPFTIVPAALFDDGRWSFAGQNQALHIFVTEKDKTELVGRFPRMLSIANEADCSSDFRSSLTKVTGKKYLHSLYPMPDKVMVWHKRKPMVRTAKVPCDLPRSPQQKLTVAKGESKMISPKISDKLAIATNTPVGPVPGTVYVWASEEDVKSRQVNKIIKGIRDLHDFHTLSGHRSAPTTALQYAWIYGETPSLEIRNNQRRCVACDEARIREDPFRKSALLSVELGDEYSADTIDSMPISHSGYKYLGHARERVSNFGAVFMDKTKSMSKYFLHWLKLVIAMVGKPPVRVGVDGGEYLTSALVGYCTERGIAIEKNLPDVHSNQAIESRHRPLIEMINAMLRDGGANDACWEFCAPTANFLLNISFGVNELRKAGWPAPDKNRPLTPFEKVVNRGKPIDLRALWNNLGGALFELVTAYEQGPKGHKARGFQGINLGLIPTEKIAIEMHGIYVLRLDDKQIVPCRHVIRHRGIYPWRPSPRRALPAPSNVEDEESDGTPSGGESDECVDSDSKHEPTTDAESKHCVGEGESSPNPEQSSHQGLPAMGTPPMEHRRKRRMKKAPKYPTGTEVMTTSGPAIVLERFSDGDYNLCWSGSPEPEDVFSLRPHEFWLVKDHPDYINDPSGNRLPASGPVEPGHRLKPFELGESEQSPTNELPVKPPPDAPAGRTRARSRIAKVAQGPREQELRMYDERYPNGERIMLYPLEPLAPSAVQNWLAKKGRLSSPPLPSNFPSHPTMADLRKMVACEVEATLPQHYHQTLSSPLRPACAKGECRELQDCLNRGVWDHPVRVAEGKKKLVIGLMWVYAIKSQKEKETQHLFDRVRSRITLMGNQERDHLPALDAYAPVAQMVTGRVLLAAHLNIDGLVLRKLDVKNAYINEDMRRTVFCRLPPGYTWVSLKNKDWTLRPLSPGEKADPMWCLPLVKALYGGMECGRIFWEAWVDWHLVDGFQIIHEERCYLCKRDDKSDSFIKLVYHVDDNLVVAKGDAYYRAYMHRVTQKFDVEEGPLKEHLGVFYTFNETERSLEMGQSAQVGKMLHQFGMENCKPTDAPTMPGPVPCIEDTLTPPDAPFDMMGFVGHATWLYQCTRPDIGQALKVLSRFTAKFGKRHVQYAKHLIRYLQGTKNQVLRYKAGYPLYYQVFTDASHASCPDTRRSILSVVIKLGGMTVYWKNTFSKIVSHSSCESELFALDIGATTGQCLRWLVQAIGGPVQGTVQVFVDNQGTINISTNPVQSGRNLHVHARYFYVRDLVYDEEYAIVFLPTTMQVADVGCTFKGGTSFRRLRQYLIDTARIQHDEHEMPQWRMLLNDQ